MARKKKAQAESEQEQQTPDVDNMSDDEFEAFMADSEPPQEEDVDTETTVELERGPEKPEDLKAETDDSKQDLESDKEKEDLVPHGQFHRERERRKQAEEAAKLAEDRLGEMLEIWRTGQTQQEQQRKQQQTQEQPQEPPNPEDDIFAYAKHLEEKIKSIETGMSQSQRVTEAEKRDMLLLQQSDQDIMSYVNENPEAEQAISYLSHRGRQHLESQGVRDQMQQLQAMRSWQVQIARQAMSLGIRPASLLMTMAKEQGWEYQAPESQNGAGQAQQKESQIDAEKEAAEQARKKEEARAGSKSLSGPGAPSGIADELTPEKVLSMSEEEWEAFKSKYGENAMDVIFNQ